jgi:enoyl-[acyl-carrier protein] reductase / trans-2-enoyl-CoA reductase (NAD+)
MILKPMIRSNICLNAHPAGCAAEVKRQIEYVKARKEALSEPRAAYPRATYPRAVLVIGASTGYGLATRINAAFGAGAATVGLSFERSPSGTKTGSPGWYNNRAFEAAARREGLAYKNIEGDGFQKETKALAVAAARELGIRYDLVVYSLAAPVRSEPETGKLYRSVIKPVGEVFRGRSLDPFTLRLFDAEVESASEEELEATVKVMGGEGWEDWIEALSAAGVLAPKATTLAYSYIGPSLSWPIYRDGTIGRAKADLERAAAAIGAKGAAEAYVSINKALVTRASAVIPVIPLYLCVLYSVMKERKVHEDCIAQIFRLFNDRLYSATGRKLELDEAGRIRMDELELSPGVQAEVEARLSRLNADNIAALADVEGFKEDFLRAHGFGVEGIDYEAEVAPDYDPAQ